MFRTLALVAGIMALGRLGPARSLRAALQGVAYFIKGLFTIAALVALVLVALTLVVALLSHC